jgi:hypothetical protein
MKSLASIALVLLTACSDDLTFEVREADGDLRFDGGETSGSWIERDGVSEIRLQRIEPGDPRVGDSSWSVTLLVAVDTDALVAGAEIPVRGTMSYENLNTSANRAPELVSWSSVDPESPVREAVLFAQCFCPARRGAETQEHDLVLRIDTVGARLRGRVEGRVIGAAGFTIGPESFDVVGDFALARE